MCNILIVGNNKGLKCQIELALSMYNEYSLHFCLNQEQLNWQILEYNYELVMLDSGILSYEDTFFVQNILKKEIPVILFTKQEEIDVRVRGLEAGMADCIIVPFECREFAARIKNILRKVKKEEINDLIYEDLKVNFYEHRIWKKEVEVKLTPKEFAVIVYFIKNSGRVVTRENLLGIIWGYEYQGETRTVDTHIQNIRKKLDLKDKLITVPKVGYCLENNRNMKKVCKNFDVL